MNRELLALVIIIATAAGALALAKHRIATAEQTSPTTIADAWRECGGKAYANPDIVWRRTASGRAEADLKAWRIALPPAWREGVKPALVCAPSGEVVDGFARLVFEETGFKASPAGDSKALSALENDVQLCVAVHKIPACDPAALEVKP